MLGNGIVIFGREGAKFYFSKNKVLELNKNYKFALVE